MERFLMPEGTKSDMENVLNRMMDGAFGNPIILSAAPTTLGEELQENSWGYFSNTLYITINGTTFSIGLTAV